MCTFCKAKHSIFMCNVNWIKTIPLMHGSMISISIGLFVINHSSELYWQRQWIIEQNLKIYGKGKITRAINMNTHTHTATWFRAGKRQREHEHWNKIYNHIKRHSIRLLYGHHFCCGSCAFFFFLVLFGGGSVAALFKML